MNSINDAECVWNSLFVDSDTFEALIGANESCLPLCPADFITSISG